MTHVCFHSLRAGRHAIWALMIGALFFGGLSLDDQFDLPVGRAPSAVLSQVLEPALDEFKLKELVFVFMLAIVSFSRLHLVLADARRAMWTGPFLSPVLAFKLNSTYRI
jgi:hypothetical protein